MKDQSFDIEMALHVGADFRARLANLPKTYIVDDRTDRGVSVR